MYTRKQLIRLLTYLPVIAVYCAFFWVENTRNFDLSSSQFLLMKQEVVTDANKADSTTNVFEPGHHKKNKDHKIRLNKRFQPQDIIFTPAITAAAPVVYVVTCPCAAYKTRYYRFELAYLPQHRGPPVMA